MRYQVFRWLSALATAALAGCLGQESPAPTSTENGDALAAFYARYGAAHQVFTYDPQRIDLFRTAGGGALATGSQAFLDIASGNPVPGPLRLEVREVLSRADMLLSGLPSMSQGRVLESGGHYLVQATTADHQLLRLSPRVKLGLATPLPAHLSFFADLRLYALAPGGVAGDDWVPATDTASSVQPSRPLLAGDPIYLRCLIAKGLYDSTNGWLSFGRPLDTGYPATTARVRTDRPTATAGNSSAYLVFHDYNAVARLPASGAGEFELANLPGNAAVTIFVLHTAGGQLYLGQREDTIRAGRVFTVTLAPSSAASVAAEAQRFR